MTNKPAEDAAYHAGLSIGIGGLLFLVFLVLKLTGVIAWSWWWVTSPLWLPALSVGLIFALIVLVTLSVAFIRQYRQGSRKR